MLARPAEAQLAADALSDVLKTVRLTGAAFFDVTARAPWVAEQPHREEVLPHFMPGAGHLIAYHVITEGRAYASLVGGEPVEMQGGDVVVVTRGDPHVVSSHPGMRAAPVPPGALNGITANQLPCRVLHGTEGEITARFVCGFLACDAQPFNPLIENLPRIIKVRDREGSAGGMLGHFIRFATAEAADKRAGGEGVLARLSELMFIEVIRRYIESLPAEQSGWLSGLRDPCIGKALSLMHGKPARDWTIEDLAKECGVSRSVLAERFSQRLGLPPMLYLAKWRMQLASNLLSDGTANIAAVAAEIGYASEAAFSRAFKKLVGVPPSEWRRNCAA